MPQLGIPLYTTHKLETQVLCIDKYGSYTPGKAMCTIPFRIAESEPHGIRCHNQPNNKTKVDQAWQGFQLLTEILTGQNVQH